jgi:hypothetical protein
VQKEDCSAVRASRKKNEQMMLSRRRTSSRVVALQKPNRRTSVLCAQNHKTGRAISQQRIWCLCFGIVSAPKKDMSEDSLFLQRGGRAISQQRIYGICVLELSLPRRKLGARTLYFRSGEKGPTREIRRP